MVHGELCLKNKTYKCDKNPAYQILVLLTLLSNESSGTVNSEIFANSVTRHICDVKHLRLGHDLLISVNNRVTLPIHEDFIFKIKPSQKFPNLQ